MNLKSKLSKLVSGFTAAVMCITMLPGIPKFSSSAASVGDKLSVGGGTTQHKGNCDGYSYEIWLDRTGGSGTMTLGSGASFKAEWSASVPSGNFLARRGLDFGSQKKATDYSYIGMDYEADYRQTGSANGNSRLCVYGWFQNKGLSGVPLVEYYIIEDWVDWVPDAPGKMVTIDGAQYKIFQMDHTGPSINSGNETFKQYFSVRQQKRKSGHITVSDHFKAWANEGWGIGNLYEVALNAEGWQSSGVADIKKLDVYTKEPVPGTTTPGTTPTPTPTPQAPSKPADGTNYFNDTFESGNGDWESRGATTLTSNSSNYYAGSKSLFVSGREDTWQGAAIPLDSSQFVPGYAYSFSTAILQNSGATEEVKLTLQYNDASGTESYDTVASANAASGKWTKLENTSYTIPDGATNLLLYVETESTTDFYIDNAVGAVEGTKSSVTTGGGTVAGGTTPPTTTPPTTQTPGTSTKPNYSSDSLVGKFGHLFKMGTSVSPHELSTGGDFIKKHFNSITPENELKPDSILDQQACQQKGNNVNTQINLSRAAQTLKFCEDNNIGVRGHTFVWYSQTPDWFFKENFSSSGAYVSKEIMNQRLESMIKNTFEAIAKQYPNLNLYAYDVCNELFLNDGGGLRGAGGPPGSYWAAVYGENNDEFIVNAFTYARKYAPAGCKLYINDYNEYIPAKTTDIYNIAMKLKEKGVIDGIGMQSHLATNYPTASMYETALKKFISTGLEVSITELDVETKGNANARAQLFKNVFEFAVENYKNIPSFTVWGTHDDISWRKNETPLLFTSNYQPKPDYEAVMSIPVPTEGDENNNNTPSTPPTTTPPSSNVVYGDANCDGKVSIADATAILQYLGNTDMFALSAEGMVNADVDGVAGVGAGDALAIQQLDAKVINSLPIGGVSTTTTKKNPSSTNPTVTTPAGTEFFNSSFDSSAGDWAGRGDAAVALNSANYYSGKSLFVSGRSDYWHGAAIELGSSFKAGSTYSFSGAVMQRSGESTSMKLTLQYTLDGEEMYDEVASATVKTNEWTKLENTSFTIPAGATGMILYVEAPDSLTDFYIDEFVGAAEGTKSSVTTGKGTVQSGTTAPPATTPSVPSTPGTIDPTKPMMAISFDDGTDPNGKKIIDALAKEGFTATFFYVGNWIKDESQVKYAYEKGMEVANHTTTHPYLTNLSSTEIRNEYDQTYNKLKKILGVEPSKLLRLPYLASNSTVTSTLSDVPMITSAIDTEDWNGASKDQIVSKIKNAMNNGSANGAIILAHETYASTAAAIEEIAPYAKAQGWQIVSISEMFAAKGQSLQGGRIYQKCN